MTGTPCGICGKPVSFQWVTINEVPYCLSCTSIARIWQNDWKGCPICGAPAGPLGQGFRVVETPPIGGMFTCSSCSAEWKINFDVKVLKVKKLFGLTSKDEVFAMVDAELTRRSSDGRGNLGERRAVEWVIVKDNEVMAIKKWTDLSPDVREKMMAPPTST